MQRCSRKATVRTQSRSNCFPFLLNIQSHSPKATVTPGRRGEASSYLFSLRGTKVVCHNSWWGITLTFVYHLFLNFSLFSKWWYFMCTVMVGKIFYIHHTKLCTKYDPSSMWWDFFTFQRNIKKCFLAMEKLQFTNSQK